VENLGITVTKTGRFDGAHPICFVAIADVHPSRQTFDHIASLGEYPEPRAWELAAFSARCWKLPIVGPVGAAYP
jgi:hypothetical protein